MGAWALRKNEKRPELEASVEYGGKRMPLWRALTAMWKKASTQEEYSANATWLRAYWDKLPFARFLALWGDLALQYRELMCGIEWESAGRRFDQIKRDAATKRWVTSMLSRVTIHDNWISSLWPVLFLAAMRNGVEVPPALDPTLPLDVLDEKTAMQLVAWLPDERRTEALIASIDRMSRDTAHQLAPKLLARWPSYELARWVIDHSEEQDESQKKILDRLRKLGKKHAVIARALAGTPDGDTGVTPVPLRVTKRQKVKKPSPLQEKQLARAARDHGGELSGITYYAVTDAKGKHRYDAYRYNADSGKVFQAGSTKVVATIIQFEVDECDDALAAGLDAVLG